MDNALGTIHAELEANSVNFRFKKVGSKRGEWRILGFLGHLTVIKNLFNVLRFNVVNPITGSVQEHVIIESEPTTILIVIVNKKYAVLTQQHRPIWSRWIVETIRGWVQDPEDILEPLRRKLPQLLGDSNQGIKGVAKLSDHKPITRLYEAPEDTGLRSNNKSIHLVNIETDESIASAQELQQLLRKNKVDGLCKPFVSTIKELDCHLFNMMKTNEPTKGLSDCQSIEGWLAFYFYRNPPQQ